MGKHQLKLADRQCRMAELSQRVQDTVTMLVTALWGHGQKDGDRDRAGRHAVPGPAPQADGRTAERPLFPRRGQAGGLILAGGFEELAGVPREEIMMKY